MIDDASKIGKWMATAFVISGIIGVGIFMLPRSLAPLGPAVPLAWLISAVGVMALGFAATRIITPEGGGMQSYVGNTLGETAGFAVTWASFFSFTVSNAAVAVGAVSFLSKLVPSLNDPGVLPVAAIGVITLLTAINALGVRTAGGLAIVTVAIRVLPLLAIMVIALTLSPALRPVADAGAPGISFDNVAAGTSLTLFALTGFEMLLALVGKVRDPARTIPLAIVGATGLCALLYLAATFALAHVMSASAIVASPSPFADAIGLAWGSGGASLAMLAITISALGCLNGGVFGVGELLYSMSLRREMPAAFARVSARHIPITALIAGNTLSALFILLNSSKATVALFTFLTTLAADGTLVLYTLASLAALKVSRTPLTRVAVAIGFAFSLFAFYGSGLEATLMVLVLLGLGFAVRAVMRSLDHSSPAAVDAPAELPGSAA